MDFVYKISPETQFSKEDFIKYLFHEFMMQRTRRLRILRFHLQGDVVQSMADIRIVKSHSLIESYEIVHDE
jgi:uncharacterized protein YpiB (UPF0302 family)